MSRQLTGTAWPRPSSTQADSRPPSAHDWTGGPRRDHAINSGRKRPPRPGRPSAFRLRQRKKVDLQALPSVVRGDPMPRAGSPGSRNAPKRISFRIEPASRCRGVRRVQEAALLGDREKDQAIYEAQELGEVFWQRQLAADQPCAKLRIFSDEALPEREKAASTPSRSRSRAASPSLLAVSRQRSSAQSVVGRRARRNGSHGSAATARRNRQSRPPRTFAEDQPRYRRGG